MQTFYVDLFFWSEEGFDHEDIDLYIRSFGAAFLIRYNRRHLIDSHHIYAQFLSSLHTLRADDDDESQRVVECLKKPFEALMTELAPRLPTSTTYLYDYLYPQWFILNATATKDATTMQPKCEEKLWRHDIDFPGEYYLLPHRRKDLRGPLASVTSYSSRQVQLLPSTSQLDPCLRGPTKVLVDDTICYFKAWKPGRGKRGATYHEILAYKKIANAIMEDKIPKDIRICRLHSVVVDSDNDLPQHYPPDERGTCEGQDSGHNKRLVGILLTYIENKGTLKSLAPWSDCAQELRLRWAEELEVLIQTLHRARLVWGDAKPDNVLVDTRDNLWLIDFGGSFTEGWVDQEKRETEDGDLQGLERIKDWLIKCSNNPVHRIVPARRD